MEDLNVLFKDVIDKYKELNTEEKYEEIVSSLKELTAFIDLLGEEKGIELGYLKSSEILDINKEGATIDDYLEAIMVYVENVKHILAQVVENNTNNY